jgi:dihydrofolate synthase/folylpolyglutamate synthase
MLAGPPDGPLALRGRQPVEIALPAGLARSGAARLRVDLPLLGGHQRMNVATAVAAAEVLARLGFTLPPDALQRGLASVEWLGRMEVVRTAPLVVVDGAHNPESALRLREGLREHFPGRRLILVLAVLSDKDLDGIAAALVPGADQVYVTRAAQMRSASPEALSAAVRRAGGTPQVEPSIAAALARAMASAGPTDMIAVAGSLMTVAEARDALANLRAEFVETKS